MNRYELLKKSAMEWDSWPDADRTYYRYLPEPWFWRWSGQATGEMVASHPVDHSISMKDWIAERERLINKSSWDDAPEWAESLGQCSDGGWEWYEDEAPECGEKYWNHELNGSPAQEGLCPAGHDWRTTLEARPVDVTPEEDEAWSAFDESRTAPSDGTSDGSTASYYELPEGATELQDLIGYRNMNYFDGMLFILCYDHAVAESSDEKLNIAREMVHYARREVGRLQGVHSMRRDEGS